MSTRKPTSPSSLTNLYAGTPDALRHRAYGLPAKYARSIPLNASAKSDEPPKYTFCESKPLGEGGTAVVFRIRDQHLQVDRALKVLLVDITTDANAAKRWEREKSALLTLETIDTSCVPSVSDIFTIDGMPAIVMQLIEGVPLDRWVAECLRRGETTLTPTEVLTIIEPLARSLQGIEDRADGTALEGFIHGDIKPSNILIKFERPTAKATVAQVWLLDFGEVAVTGAEEQTGITPAFASPEQIAALASGDMDTLSSASDQYQLGVVLEEVLKLMAPTDSAAWWRWSMPRWRSHIEKRELRRIGSRMTARLAANRYQSFQEVVNRINGVRQLANRRLRFYGSWAASLILLVLLVSLMLSRTQGEDRVELNPVVANRIADDEWYRWIEDFTREPLEVLAAELKVTKEDWEVAYGSENATYAEGELQKRLSLLQAGRYRFSVQAISLNSDTVKDWAEQEVSLGPLSTGIPVELALWIDIDYIEVGKLTGQISESKGATLQVQDLVFDWVPGQTFDLYIDYMSSQKIYIEAKRAENKRLGIEDDVFNNHFRNYPVPEVSPFGADNAGPGLAGALSLPIESQCWGVNEEGFFGTYFDQRGVEWIFQIAPLKD